MTAEKREKISNTDRAALLALRINVVIIDTKYDVQNFHED